MVATVFPRRMEGRLTQLLAEEPVVMLVGPRACGKSFTSERVVGALGGSILRLDNPAERQIATDDPTGYLRDRAHPVLVDEYQHVPELLAVIKAQLSERGARAGAYLVTGSVRADLVGQHERLTGRVHRARMQPLSVDEALRRPETRFLASVLSALESLAGWREPTPAGSLEYLRLVSRGGFPLAVERGDVARRRWYRDYVEDTVLRDALDHARIRKPDEMLRLLRVVAARSGRAWRDTSLEQELQLDRHTVGSYREVLTSLFLVDPLPPWRTNRSQRQVKAPKYHMTDTGLAMALLGVDRDALRHNPTLAGHLLETFVVGELRKQASWLDDPPELLHFSESGRAEVDVVVERTDERILGIEVKLASRIRPDHLKGLRRLRDVAGTRWTGGLILAAVPAAYRTGDGIVIAPLSALWGFGG